MTCPKKAYPYAYQTTPASQDPTQPHGASSYTGETQTCSAHGAPVPSEKERCSWPRRTLLCPARSYSACSLRSPPKARPRGLEVWSAGADRWRPETQIFREKKNGIRVDEDMGQGPREKEREREGGREGARVGQYAVVVVAAFPSLGREKERRKKEKNSGVL